MEITKEKVKEVDNWGITEAYINQEAKKRSLEMQKQGIKRGIVELADSIVITKADGDNLVHAKNAVNSYKTALHYFPIKSSGWIPKVYEYSFQNIESIERIYKLIISFFKHNFI